MYMLLFLYLPQYLLLIVGIPMGTNCDPLINDVIIYTAMIVNLCLRSTTDPSKHSQISLFKISEDTYIVDYYILTVNNLEAVVVVIVW